MFGSGRRRRALYAALAVIVVIVAILAYGYADTYRIQIKEYSFSDPDLPTAFEGVRVALVTDIHRGPFFSENRVRSLVDRVDSLKPDLIALGGDYVFAGTKYAESCFAALQDLHAPLGTFAVLGNHDFGKYDHGERGPALVVKAANDVSIPLLEDQGVWVEKNGQRIRVGGINDSSLTKPSLGSVLEGTRPSDFVLLLSHNPDFAETIRGDTVDLVLSGHTHGGQATFFGLVAHVPSDYGMKYRTGMVKAPNTTVIVSNGIGTSTIPPIRLCAPAQIVVITLHRGPASGSSGNPSIHL